MLQELLRIPLPRFLENWLGREYVPIYGYGVMIVIGFLLGAQLMRYMARRHGFDGETFVNAALIGLVAGVIGGRVSHVLENWSAFADPSRSAGENFRAMINVSSGGLTFYGGFLFATPILILYGLWKKVPLLRGMDIVAPSLMLALAFGRLGCFLNGCCHGDKCDLPWAVRFPYASNAYVEHYEEDFDAGRSGMAGAINPPPELQTGKVRANGMPILKSKEEVRDPEGTAKAMRNEKRYDEARRIESQTPEERDAAKQAMPQQRSHPVHPAQLYSVFNAAFISAVLVAFLTLSPVPGRVFALMLLLKGGSRFVLELLRVEPPVWGPLSYSMVISIFLVAAGIAMWIGCGWLARRQGDGASPRGFEPRIAKT